MLLSSCNTYIEKGEIDSYQWTWSEATAHIDNFEKEQP